MNDDAGKKIALEDFWRDGVAGIFLPPAPGSRDKRSSYRGNATENYIYDSLKRAGDVSDNSEELVPSVMNWETQYHLGIGRANCLKALELPGNASVLEIGSECGAITRYLGERFRRVDGIEGNPARARIARERCRDLDNVKIYSANIRQIELKPKYDIVTLFGVLEHSPLWFGEAGSPTEACLGLLETARSALKENGVLVLALENKIGIKYWSGCPEEHTGKLFDSINGYPGKGNAITFSQKEICELLHRAGYRSLSCYYCYPDYKFASTVISEGGDEREYYLHNWIGTPFLATGGERRYLFHEGLALKTLSGAGLLRSFANSFLLVGRLEEGPVGPEDWIVKKFSSRRRKQYRTVTTLKLKPDIYVEKKLLDQRSEVAYPTSGDGYVKHNVENSAWIKGDLAIFEVYKTAYDDSGNTRLIDILKNFHREVMREYSTGASDEEGYPLLRGSAVDATFFNAIRNGRLYFIDEEWEVGEVPADYVLYRTIRTMIDLQKPWMTGKANKKFILSLIREVYPRYDGRRLAQNAGMDKKLNATIAGGVVPIILPPKLSFLQSRVVLEVARKILKI